MYGISYGMSPIMLTFSKIQDNGYAMLQRLKYASSLGLIRMSALSIFTSVQLQRCLFVTGPRDRSGPLSSLSLVRPKLGRFQAME